MYLELTNSENLKLSPSSVSEALTLASVLRPGIILSSEDSKTPAQIAALKADKARACGLLSGLLGDDGSLISVTRAKEIPVDE